MGALAASVGAIGTGIVGQAIVGERQAQVQGRAAEARLAQQREDRRLSLEAVEPSPEEIAQIERSIELNEQDISRKQRLIDAADPALIEAGQQALRLLQGQEARTLDPIRRIASVSVINWNPNYRNV